VAIYRLLQQSAFTPEDINRLARAYEETLRALHIADGSDPLAERVARAIIEIAQTGERDPQIMTQRTLAVLGRPSEA
jgi:hypothetical protein